MDQLPHRSLNILTNRNVDGSHRLVINGNKDAIALNLSEGQMRDAINTVREALLAIRVEGKESTQYPVPQGRKERTNLTVRVEIMNDNVLYYGLRTTTAMCGPSHLRFRFFAANEVKVPAGSGYNLVLARR